MELSPEKKIAGILAPLFGLRGENDLGIGDVAVLREFIDWVADIGFKLVQLLPINETGGDHSPYNAISAMAIEPTTLHLAPGSPEDLTRDDFEAALAGVDLGKLRHGPVKYDCIKKLKRSLLERAFAKFSFRANEDRQSIFRNFCVQEASWLDDYAFFRGLMEENDGSEAWDGWPPEQQHIESARAWLGRQSGEKKQKLLERENFFRYVQWVAHEQWSAIKSYADQRGVVLMGDIPFGINYCSADVYARRDEFALDCAAARRQKCISRMTRSLRNGGKTGGSHFSAGI